MRTPTDAASAFDRLIIPAGAEGTALEAMPDQSCLAEMTRLPPTGDEDADEYRRAMLAEEHFRYRPVSKREPARLGQPRLTARRSPSCPAAAGAGLALHGLLRRLLAQVRPHGWLHVLPPGHSRR